MLSEGNVGGKGDHGPCGGTLISGGLRSGILVAERSVYSDAIDIKEMPTGVLAWSSLCNSRETKDKNFINNLKLPEPP